MVDIGLARSYLQIGYHARTHMTDFSGAQVFVPIDQQAPQPCRLLNNHRFQTKSMAWDTISMTRTASTSTKKKPTSLKRIGKLPPRYRFFLNPYPDVRFTTCPQCTGKTRQRKLPLVIHIDPMNPLALNKTCRYCPYCDLLIAHQDEIEAVMAAMFTVHKPEIVGNDYLVLGTMDRPEWKRGLTTPLSTQEMVTVLHDFKEVVRFELGGWGP
jgi:hypothetical protein